MSARFSALALRRACTFQHLCLLVEASVSNRLLASFIVILRNSRGRHVRHALLAAGLALVGPTTAQTCASPGTWPSPDPPDSSPTMDVDTCLGDPPVPLCAFGYFSSGPAAAVLLHYNPACMQHLGQLHVSAYESDITPIMFLSNQPGDCGGQAGSCVDTGGPAAPISFDGLPAGDYQIIVASSDFDQSGACGWVRLAFDGHIDTEGACSGEDIIFRYGFDGKVINRPALPAGLALADALRRATR